MGQYAYIGRSTHPTRHHASCHDIIVIVVDKKTKGSEDIIAIQSINKTRGSDGIIAMAKPRKTPKRRKKFSRDLDRASLSSIESEDRSCTDEDDVVVPKENIKSAAEKKALSNAQLSNFFLCIKIQTHNNYVAAYSHGIRGVMVFLNFRGVMVR
mmetsp:Transcript_16995/g.24213  ORF Transcript_16995/g.24213 Transcript_16995/m.24213 type:complete len:154 (+) Transcript_16995:72-533(+)